MKKWKDGYKKKLEMSIRDKEENVMVEGGEKKKEKREGGGGGGIFQRGYLCRITIVYGNKI